MFPPLWKREPTELARRAQTAHPSEEDKTGVDELRGHQSERQADSGNAGKGGSLPDLEAWQKRGAERRRQAQELALLAQEDEGWNRRWEANQEGKVVRRAKKLGVKKSFYEIGTCIDQLFTQLLPSDSPVIPQLLPSYSPGIAQEVSCCPQRPLEGRKGAGGD